MVSKLATAYGPYIASVDGEAFHDFPSPAMLNVPGVEERLRALGFGYRARYIAQTARMLDQDLPAGWLDGLRNPRSPAIGTVISPRDTESPCVVSDKPTGLLSSSYTSAHAALLTLPGVGPKVSDCVCLMGLGWHEAVPVDTHVWQIATRDYGFGLGKKGLGKTFNKAVHDAVGDHFRGIWGEYAGWAQSVLFTANLKSFAEQAGGVSRRKQGRKEDGVVESVKVEVEEKEAVVKVEGSLEEVSAEGNLEEVKVERKTVVRKRKITAIVPEGDVVSTENGEVEKVLLLPTRKSKRIKEQAQVERV
jgi:N-glycosylase/DNA lyase